MMVVLAKVLIGFIAALLVDSSHAYTSIEANYEHAKWYVSSQPGKFSNEKAFQILDNKCNVCHRTQNKRRVFTSENMDTWAEDIYAQVFIKKRMPKGKKIKLTSTEYQELLTWISSTKTSNHGI